MFVISPDFGVCWQIFKRNPESFEKSTKIGPEKENNLYIKNRICQQKMWCVANIIVAPTSVR